MASNRHYRRRIILVRTVILLTDAAVWTTVRWGLFGHYGRTSRNRGVRPPRFTAGRGPGPGTTQLRVVKGHVPGPAPRTLTSADGLRPRTPTNSEPILLTGRSLPGWCAPSRP